MTSSMGNFLSNLVGKNKQKKKKPLPIDTLFSLPSPLPSWPPGGDFASGIIDLGGLQVLQISQFTKVWAALEGGPDNLGATFFEPSSIPQDFFMLGCYAQSNNKPLSGWILAAKDTGSALSPPTDYTLVWTSQSQSNQDYGTCYMWLPTPPDGYKSMGLVVTVSPDKPPLDRIRCVRADFTDANENVDWIWGPGEDIILDGINIYTSRPANRGVQAMGVPTGTFLAQNNGLGFDLPCLKNIGGRYTALPNADQINALVRSYSPRLYFHPEEKFLPASVTWLFENGALLYTKGDEANPVRIDPSGSNLPQGGSNDDAYWIDLPLQDGEKERVKKGDLGQACAYIHVKPMFGGTFTDMAIWIFYPFNGPARAKVEFFNVPLGRIGEHVGDWEHLTLRISNFNGELKSMYYSQHSKGVWMDAPELEFDSGNKPVAYSSLHGHSFYPRPGVVMQGSGNVGIRNDSEKGKYSMDCGAKYLVVNAEYYEEPKWVNYARKWGPKIDYKREEEMGKVEKVLPGKLKGVFERIIKSLPREVFGEEGPLGPKWKDSWTADERS